ncbi:Sel1 domain protein repeat-containing protein [Seminavis robusta]|uniref:Sel1 domain protein repeat-containing protein n=1 Tax=Seminavis robusta TaxID=568900 RepID=A0A9N8EDL6_9STRA|nr:Sel1 domain protein repeat-containing protein [Seminavis robusta]|eukprot:Sro792_g203190.1 Sel1 domain protein repeat-containing protein (361) ;mRNA; r:44432-45601
MRILCVFRHLFLPARATHRPRSRSSNDLTGLVIEIPKKDRDNDDSTIASTATGACCANRKFHLDSISHGELQQECKKSELSASGTPEVLRNRLRRAKQAKENRHKENEAIDVHAKDTHAKEHQAKRTKESVADDLICPISLDLPWDPVTAEDGRVYDRECIETHFHTHCGDLKSPITNEKMGSKLLPAVQHRNIIEALLESGAIDGDLAAKWNEKVKQKDWLKKAQKGDPYSMWGVGLLYDKGLLGLKQDKNLAFQWMQRAHDAGDVRATASLGANYLRGNGTPKCPKKGMMYVSIAAGQGSNLAAYYLGMALANGGRGMHNDKQEAIKWLAKAVGVCPYMNLSEDAVNEAQEKLNQLLA